MKILVPFIVISGILLGSSCQTNSSASQTIGETNTTPTIAAPTQGEFEMTPLVPTPADSGLQALIEAIRADLAGRITVPTDEIILMELTEVEWSDSSLDCPQPGMSYLQVITPGYRVLLQAGNLIYEYHTNRDSHFVYCENQIPPNLPTP